MTDGSTRIVTGMFPTATALLNQIAQKVVQEYSLPRELTAAILSLFWANKQAFPSSLPF